jgi:hypothetical protein
MIVQTALGQKLVYQKPMVVFEAVTNQFHKIRMMQLSQVIDFCLYHKAN